MNRLGEREKKLKKVETWKTKFIFDYPAYDYQKKGVHSCMGTF